LFLLLSKTYLSCKFLRQFRFQIHNISKFKERAGRIGLEHHPSSSLSSLLSFINNTTNLTNYFVVIGFHKGHSFIKKIFYILYIYYFLCDLVVEMMGWHLKTWFWLYKNSNNLSRYEQMYLIDKYLNKWRLILQKLHSLKDHFS